MQNLCSQSLLLLLLSCACSHQQAVDSALTLKYSLCKTAGAYTKALTSVQSALGLHTQVGIRELSIQHGCPQAVDLARKVLQTFKEQMSSDTAAAAVAAVPGAIVTAATIPATLLATRSIYPCVAFYLSCRALKLSGVDKKRLLASAQTTEREFSAVSEAFRQVMPELRPPEPSSSTPVRKRKKPATDAADGDLDAAAA